MRVSINQGIKDKRPKRAAEKKKTKQITKLSHISIIVEHLTKDGLDISGLAILICLQFL